MEVDNEAQKEEMEFAEGRRQNELSLKLTKEMEVKDRTSSNSSVSSASVSHRVRAGKLAHE